MYDRPGGLAARGGPAGDRAVRGVPHRALPQLHIDAQLKVQTLPFSTPRPPRSGVERSGTHPPLMGRSGRFDGTASSVGGYADQVSLGLLTDVSRASNAAGPAAADAGTLAVPTRHLRRRPGRRWTRNPGLPAPATTATRHRPFLYLCAVPTRAPSGRLVASRFRPQLHPQCLRSATGMTTNGSTLTRRRANDPPRRLRTWPEARRGRERGRAHARASPTATRCGAESGSLPETRKGTEITRITRGAGGKLLRAAGRLINGLRRHPDPIALVKRTRSHLPDDARICSNDTSRVGRTGTAEKTPVSARARARR